MSADTDMICRAIYYQLLTSKDLRQALKGVKAIIGEENVALVEKQVADDEYRKE